MAYKYNPKRKKLDPRRYNRALKFHDVFPPFQGPVTKGHPFPCRCGCGEPLQGRERSWRPGHEAAPLDLYRLAKGDTGTIRKVVFARDQGVCGGCQMDTVAEAERCRRWKVFDDPAERVLANAAREKWMLAGFPSPDTRGKNWWESDHIIEVVNGGGNDLANFQTLCLVCHKKKTAANAAKRAQTRRMRTRGPQLFAV